MIDPLAPDVQTLRMHVEDFNLRLLSGEPITVLDARNEQDWESSQVKIRGAIRVQSAKWRPHPSWPKDRLMVVY